MKTFNVMAERHQWRLIISVLLFVLSGTVLNAQPEVKSVSYTNQYNMVPAGYTADEEYMAYLVRYPRSVQIVKADLNGYTDQKYSLDAAEIRQAALSPDGDHIAWVETTYLGPAQDDRIFLFEFATEITTELALPELPEPADDKLTIRHLKFIKGTGELTYMLGPGAQYPDLKQLVRHNISNDNAQLIAIEELPVNFGKLVFNEYEFSDDGNTLLYHAGVLYSATDCCYRKPGYLVWQDTGSAQSKVVIDLTENNQGFKVALSGDGKTFVYQNNQSLYQYSVNTGASDIIELNGLAAPLSDHIKWMDLSFNGNMLAVQGNGKFTDGNVFEQHKQLTELRFGTQFINFTYRPDVILAKNLQTGESTVLNKFNEVQLYPAVPIALNSTGDSLYYATKQLGTVHSFVTHLLVKHAIEFIPFQADEAITGAWFDAQNPGQGLFISVAPNPNQNPNFSSISEGQAVPIISWYTVDNQGNPYWLLVEGTFAGSSIAGEAYLVTGSQFGANYQTTDTETTVWGEVTINFADCQSATLNYEPVLEGFEAGQMALNRLTTQSGLGCL